MKEEVGQETISLWLQIFVAFILAIAWFWQATVAMSFAHEMSDQMNVAARIFLENGVESAAGTDEVLRVTYQETLEVAEIPAVVSVTTDDDVAFVYVQLDRTLLNWFSFDRCDVFRIADGEAERLRESCDRFQQLREDRLNAQRQAEEIRERRDRSLAATVGEGR